MSRILAVLKGWMLEAMPGRGRRRSRRFPPSRPIMLLLLCGASLIVVVVGTTALTLANLRNRTMAESEHQLLSKASVLGRIAGRDFQAIELVEKNLIEQMEAAAVV